MNIDTISVGLLAANCYLVWAEGSADALVIDPGDESERIVSRLRELGLTPRGVLLTHAHVDHIRGIPGLVAAYPGLPVSVHPADRELYASPANELLPWLPAARDLPGLADEPPTVDGLSYRILPTPGHTPGGVCYYFEEAGVLFSGDTMFKSSIGRTDFKGGNLSDLLHSISEQLFTLPGDTVVYPGHQDPTTIGDEMTSNPFVG